MEHSFSLLITAFSGVAGVLGASFWAKKWIGDVDKSLMELARKVSKLTMKVELANSSSAKTEGSLAQIQKSINETIGELARTTAKIDALWRLMDKHFDELSLTRISDKNP